MKKIYFYFFQRKFFFINLFFFLYIFVNLLDGNRGYFSYVKKSDLLINKIEEEKNIVEQLEFLRLKNSMLSLPNLNLDFLDQLYRSYFVLGKKGEKLYLVK
jgi:cell division protein DivIC